jgi:hypothetical protein
MIIEMTILSGLHRFFKSFAFIFDFAYVLIEKIRRQHRIFDLNLKDFRTRQFIKVSRPIKLWDETTPDIWIKFEGLFYLNFGYGHFKLYRKLGDNTTTPNIWAKYEGYLNVIGFNKDNTEILKFYQRKANDLNDDLKIGFAFGVNPIKSSNKNKKWKIKSSYSLI